MFQVYPRCLVLTGSCTSINKVSYACQQAPRKICNVQVHACEWNPHAIEGLVQGLKLNGVSDKCQIHQGDCRQVAPVGCADRVLLGLLPSSEDGWETALRALKPSGQSMSWR